MKNGKITNLSRIVARLTCFVVLLFSCPLFVHGATTVKKLPYDYSWNYISLGDNNIQNMLSRASGHVDISHPNLIVFWTEVGTNAWAWTYCVAVVDSVTLPNNKTYDTVDLTTDSIIFNFSESYIGMTDLNNFWEDANQNYAPSNFELFGTNAIYVGITPNGGTYRKMPLYGNVSINDIVYIGQGEIDPTPTDPNAPDPITPNAPVPDLPDFPDTVTVESLLQWIGESIQAIGSWCGSFGSWLKNAFNKIIDNIYNGFKNVIDNFKSLFKPFIDKVLAFQSSITQKFDDFVSNILSLVNSVLSGLVSIRNLIGDFLTAFQTFVTNILSLVANIKDAILNVKQFFDYIVSIGTENGQFTLTTLFVNLFIPSSADINQAFIDTDSFALITFFKTAFNKVSTIWDSIVNASVKKSIHVNGFVFHGVTIPGFDIDFSWFDNIKSYSDVIISAFLIINYIWFIFFRAPSFIRGHSNMSGAVGGVIDNHDSKGNVT